MGVGAKKKKKNEEEEEMRRSKGVGETPGQVAVERRRRQQPIALNVTSIAIAIALCAHLYSLTAALDCVINSSTLPNSVSGSSSLVIFEISEAILSRLFLAST